MVPSIELVRILGELGYRRPKLCLICGSYEIKQAFLGIILQMCICENCGHGGLLVLEVQQETEKGEMGLIRGVDSREGDELRTNPSILMNHF